MVENYLALGLINIMALFVLMYMAKRSDILERQRQKSYLAVMIVTIIVIIAELNTLVFECGGSRFYICNTISNIVGFALSPFIPLLLAKVFDDSKNNTVKWASLPNFLNLALVLSSPFTGFVFHISSENIYDRGPLFMIYIISYAWSILVLFLIIFSAIRHAQRKTQVLMLAAGLFVFGGTTIQIINPEIHTTWTCVTMALILNYAIICELDNKHDKLTKLLNRKVYEWELKQLESAKSAAIIMLDIDDFKITNDTYGHLYGDYCLQTLAAIIKDIFSELGGCFRIGGDEFCILSRTADEDTITKALKEMVQNITVCRENNPKMPMVSFGYAFYSKDDGRSVEDTIKEADDQMYTYKRKHKDCRV